MRKGLPFLYVALGAAVAQPVCQILEDQDLSDNQLPIFDAFRVPVGESSLSASYVVSNVINTITDEEYEITPLQHFGYATRQS